MVVTRTLGAQHDVAWPTEAGLTRRLACPWQTMALDMVAWHLKLAASFGYVVHTKLSWYKYQIDQNNELHCTLYPGVY